MPQIRLLDQATVNKIAAGEVVERPASIVKEMVENAIDAGASRITVEIRDGGIGLIRITDNGCGIESGQVRTAFLRHSTSKIRQVEDLHTSVSLGFRGEALASIAAVARVEMLTRPASEYTGTRFVIEGGIEKVFEEIACPVGTTVRVENLFFTTPARRKFLKKPAQEAAVITDLVQKIAMGHPEIAFRYINGKKEPSLQTPGTGSLKNDVFAVYGKDIVDKLIPVDGSIPLSDNKQLKIEGFISRPQLTRANRSYENFFINGRYVRSPLLEKGIDEAYKDYIVPGSFPVVVLQLTMDPDTLDVNVHPTKMEVKFMEEDKTRFGLYEVISETLRKADLVARVGDFYREVKPIASEPQNEQKGRMPVFSRELTPAERTVQSVLPGQAASQKKIPDYAPFSGHVPRGAVKANDIEVPWPSKPKENSRPAILEEEGSPVGLAKKPAEVKVHEETFKTAPPEQTTIEIVTETVTPEPHQLRIVGQIFRTYWIAEEKDVFYIVDQHAAHERVLYDRYRQMLQNEHMDSQELMEPVVLTLDPKAVTELPSFQPILEKLGYQVEAFGEDAVIVRGVPFLFGKSLSAEDLAKMMEMLFEGQTDTARDLLIDEIATMSCKAAVKGNDALSMAEAQSLLDQLFASPNPYNCPHGRPTIISFTQYELEKRFKRV